jgi:hypothetical protein
MGVTYDAGALIAADRGERRMWARHEALLRLGAVPMIPTPVLAQAWRGGSRQARLARLVAGCDFDAPDETVARLVGELLAAAGTADVVDGFVVEGALRRRDLVVTSDPDDLMSLARAVDGHLELEAP